MTVTASRLRAVVIADTSQGQAGLKGFGKQVTETAATTQRALGSVSKVLAGSFGSFGGLGPIGVGLGLAAISVSATKAASDSEEALNKMKVVFSASSSSITSFSQNAARDLGMSKTQAIEAAGTFGNLFTSMGLGQPAAASMSQGIVKLAADLGSFNNIPIDVMLEKLRSGMVGEVEPLRAVGINLSAAAVNAKAMEMGLADASGEVSQAATLQARYALMLDQSKNAQGDFARTSDGLANSLKIAQGEVAGIKVQLGLLTIKPYTAVVHIVSEGLAEVNAQLGMGSADPGTKLAAFESHLKLMRDRAAETQRYLENMDKATDPVAYAVVANNLRIYKNEIAQASAELIKLKDNSEIAGDAGVSAALRTAAAMYAAKTASIAWGDAGAGAVLRIAEAEREATAAAAALAKPTAEAAAFAEDLGGALARLRGKEAGANLNAVAAEILAGKLNEAEVAAHGLSWALDQIGGPSLDPSGVGKGVDKGAERIKAQAVVDATIAQAELNRIDREQRRAANTAIASDYATKMKAAGSEIASALKGDMSAGMNTAIGLLDLRGPEANDPNGPFRDMFRVLDVAKLGNASPWQEGLGIDQDMAKEIGRKFETGMWDDMVTKFIDVDALKNAVKEKQLGQQFMDAFAESLADGTSGGSTGEKKKSGIGELLVPAMLKSIDAQLVADASKFSAKGAAAFASIETGFIAQATNSTAFVAAINAMVDNSLARYTGAE